MRPAEWQPALSSARRLASQHRLPSTDKKSSVDQTHGFLTRVFVMFAAWVDGTSCALTDSRIMEEPHAAAGERSHIVERRDRLDRRVRSLSGRRPYDRPLARLCSICGESSARPVDVADDGWLYRCGGCDHSWTVATT